jgi:hypothetical protein
VQQEGNLYYHTDWVQLDWASWAHLYRWRDEARARNTFAWISHNRRMSKDYERLCSTGEAFVYAARTRLMLRRLAYG